MNEHWKEWQVPDDGEPTGAFDSDGQSRLAFDYLTGMPRVDLEAWIFGDVLYVKRLGDPMFRINQWEVDTRSVIASCPVPDTLEETTSWLRMVAAMYGGDR